MLVLQDQANKILIFKGSIQDFFRTLYELDILH